ncbi:P pilus assembly protein chaperone PapD [Vibrio sp. B1REV9]|uniref:fimbria/pilus periplasmic chaperone n=1 Tax=Vibrio sp. B1REV9 TaxID=2751179 RepID=UPI001AF810DF|nr:fimbria/pilus periplasmic chaperone [Vibrio sp. B1REV9]CAE6937599.1 P pilus assembly protein chaperone PapD [Vibrio sp. B1REV9]
MNKLKIILLQMCLVIVSSNTYAALGLDSSRYIYNSDQESISGIISNNASQDYGAQVWVESDIENDTNAPKFIATPSFFQIKRKGKQVFRLMAVNDAITHKVNNEQLYWLNIQEIPPKMNGNGLAFAIRNRVKLIYRPEALTENRYKAEREIKLVKEGGETYLVNPTPYIFAISTIENQDGESISFNQSKQDELSVFRPGARVKVSSKSRKIFTINDDGNIESYILNND